jgi:hypothetical protein
MLVVFSGCIDNEVNNDDWWEYEVVHYSVGIQTNKSDNFFMYLPVPLISNGNNPKKGEPIELMNELKIINGSINYQIEETLYGYALKINFSDDFEITAHREFNNATVEAVTDYIFVSLSMAFNEHTNSPNWIYVNSTNFNGVNLTFKAYYISDHAYGGHRDIWNAKICLIDAGWQMIPLHQESIIIN